MNRNQQKEAKLAKESPARLRQRIAALLRRAHMAEDEVEELGLQLAAMTSRAELAERECEQFREEWREAQVALAGALDREAVLEEQVEDLRHALHASRVMFESLDEPAPTFTRTYAPSGEVLAVFAPSRDQQGVARQGAKDAKTEGGVK